MKCLLLITILVLSGCCTVQPVPEPQIVKVPVKVACIDDEPARPIYLTGTGEWPGDVEAARRIIIDLEAAQGYGTAWEAAAAGCVK